MSQARATASQTVKSLSYFYKVCSGSNASRCYCSISSFKTRPLVNEFPPIGKNSSGYSKDWSFRESKNEYDQNSYVGYGGNSMGIQRNRSEVYGQSYNHNGNDQYMMLNEEGRNVQSSYKMTSGISKQVIGDGNDEYLQNYVTFQETQGNCNMGEDGFLQSQYNLNGSCNGDASSNEQSSSENCQIAIEERQLFGTIEVLDGFCKDGRLKEAVEVLGLLEQNYVIVDIPRYLFLMKACGESRALTEAKHVHYHLARSIPHFDVCICNKILEMYSKCGSMKDAYKVFDKMPQRNLTSWDTMITWFAKNGHGEDAIEMFTEFKRIGLKPDHQMFFGVFTACSVLGDMREGLLHFESMIKTYNLVPSVDHYTSVVNMLASAGYLNEAVEFIEKMAIEPSVEIYVIMMNQSRIHGYLQLGDRFAEIVNILDPSCLDEQSKEGLIRIKPSDIAKEKEKEKKKWSGSIPPDIKSTYRQYKAGDTSHPDHEKLYSQLRCLKQTMKEVGYVPETKFVLHDVDQESKEEALLAHSERLALSQLLLTTPARAPIRIMKNLRVCNDCHKALKIISKVVGRLIVARDAKRFHHFENGECSCGDYW